MMRKIPGRRTKGELDYFAWIAALPCIVSGSRPVQVAHVRGADSWWEKELPGMGRKPSIPYVVPLVPRLHLEQEAANWRFWKRNGMGPLPAQSSILFHCWILWTIYKIDPTTSHRTGVLYIEHLIAEREDQG
jgi:hypothetical protein